MALLQVNHLSKRFGGLKAVDRLTFGLDAGEILALIGPNGAGKTTVINLISGALSPDSGQILLRGRNVNGMRQHDRCKLGLARTFQKVRVFSDLSVYDNIRTGLTFGKGTKTEDARNVIHTALTTVGLETKEALLAKNLNIPDKKKLQIAIALSTDPKVLLLDEPMAGLSLNEIQETQSLLRTLRQQGLAIMIVEHLMVALAEVTDRAIVMDEGQKLLEGTLNEVLADERVIRAYLGQKHADSKQS